MALDRIGAEAQERAMRVLVCAVLLLASLLPAAAQQTEGAPPPYEADLMHLAEILGALHYLRPLCGAPEGTRWRDEMQALIDAEQPSDKRRGQIIASFNRGYSSYGEVYRACTDSAAMASRRYLDEGARLSRDIAARYGSN